MAGNSAVLSPERLAAFFAAYAAGFNQALRPAADLNAIASRYTDAFLASDPNGVQTGTKGSEFIATLRKGYDFYRSIGTQSMTVAGIDVTPIDDLHALASVHWDSRYEKDGAEVRIPFDVHYLVKDVGGEAKVFAWISGDESALLQEAGLLPEQTT